MAYTLTNTELNMAFELPDETVINAGASYSFIESVKKVNRLPINIGEIYYSDNIWDFSPYVTVNIAKHSLRISFKSVNQPFCDELKNYVLLKVLENREKIQTIRGRALELRKFFAFLYEHHCFSVDTISIDMIKAYIKTREADKNQLGIFEIKKTIKNFCMTYSTNFSDILSNELIRFLDERNVKLLNAIRHKNKTPDIPQEYFNKLLAALISMMRDENLDIDYRAIACLHIIESQTGLRINEVLNLDVNALKTIPILSGEESNYLSYNTWKRESGNNVSSKETTYINALSKEAFLTLKKLHAPKRKLLKSNYLYMGSKKRCKAEEFPLDYDAFMRDENYFYIQLNTLLPVINLAPEDYPMLTTKQSKIKIDFTGTLKEPIRTITAPGHHQYRVHCCTELYNRGVPLQYIQRFMGHLSHEMEGYYVRPKNTIQEDLAFSTEILKDIVTGNARLLGGDKGLKEKIDNYISENNLSVYDDLNKICSLLSEKIPIRQKFGGVCIKSSVLRECSIDAKTNEFYCAYSVCPNIFHFYYMADISYRQAKELTDSIRINKERGLLRQVQKDQNTLLTIIRKKLIPEIDELKYMIKTKGLEFVYQNHPEVQPIAENIEVIERNIQEWTTQIS